MLRRHSTSKFEPFQTFDVAFPGAMMFKDSLCDGSIETVTFKYSVRKAHITHVNIVDQLPNRTMESMFSAELIFDWGKVYCSRIKRANSAACSIYEQRNVITSLEKFPILFASIPTKKQIYKLESIFNTINSKKCKQITVSFYLHDIQVHAFMMGVISLKYDDCKLPKFIKFDIIKKIKVRQIKGLIEKIKSMQRLSNTSILPALI